MFSSPYYRYIALSLIIVSMFAPIASDSLWLREAVNTAHSILFIFIACFLYLLLKDRLPDLYDYRLYLLTIVTAMLLGVLIEAAQFYTGREMSGQDLYRDFFGVMAGLGLVAFVAQDRIQVFSKASMIPVLVFVCFLFMGVGSLLQLSWSYCQRSMAFPVLVDFDKSWSQRFVRFNRAEIISVDSDELSESGKLYRMVFKPAQYPGFSVIETEADWSEYQYLSFYVISQYSKEVQIMFRVHDSEHNQEYSDRFNKRINIVPGINEIIVALSDVKNAPDDRALDLSAVAGMKLFAVNLENEMELEISNIKLY